MVSQMWSSKCTGSIQYKMTWTQNAHLIPNFDTVEWHLIIACVIQNLRVWLQDVPFTPSGRNHPTFLGKCPWTTAFALAAQGSTLIGKPPSAAWSCMIAKGLLRFILLHVSQNCWTAVNWETQVFIRWLFFLYLCFLLFISPCLDSFFFFSSTLINSAIYSFKWVLCGCTSDNLNLESSVLKTDRGRRVKITGLLLQIIG